MKQSAPQPLPSASRPSSQVAAAMKGLTPRRILQQVIDGLSQAFVHGTPSRLG